MGALLSVAMRELASLIAGNGLSVSCCCVDATVKISTVEEITTQDCPIQNWLGGCDFKPTAAIEGKFRRGFRRGRFQTKVGVRRLGSLRAGMRASTGAGTDSRCLSPVISARMPVLIWDSATRDEISQTRRSHVKPAVGKYPAGKRWPASDQHL
jgi:hypothetical protein